MDHGTKREPEKDYEEYRVKRKRKIKEDEDEEEDEDEDEEEDEGDVNETDPAENEIHPNISGDAHLENNEEMQIKNEEDEGDMNKTDPAQNRIDPNIPDDVHLKNDEEEIEDENEDNSSISNPNTPSKFKKVNKPGRPAEAGVISEVYVENFMCHRKLTVKLCRNVNFINGQNGSGKSAILAAIQICLGAGAKRTHRAQNLKEMIRKEAGTNCSGAKVRVTLYNQGDDAFMHDVYGDFITVERSISHRGYNGYKLLNHKGSEKSRSKKDLDSVLDQLNIQVENPVAVLDQEEAKKFLTGKAEDKYNFFTKATDLERLDRSYANIHDNISTLQMKGDSLRRSLEPAYNNVKMLKKEWEAFEELDKLRDKMAQQEILYGWSLYHVDFVKAENERNLLKDIEEKYEKRKSELENMKESSNSPEEEANLNEKINSFAEEATKGAEDKNILEEEVKMASEPIKQNKRMLVSLARELKAAEHSHRSAQKTLQIERERILKAAGSAETEEAKRVAKMKAAEEELEAAQNTMDIKKRNVASLLSKYEELEPHVEQAKANTQSSKTQLGGVNRRLKEMQSNSSNSMAVFGPSCVAMFRKINEKKKYFRGPVVGPIGMHIKISPGKEQFAKLAETALGAGVLDSFIVTNDNDRKLLTDLRREVGCPTRECNIFQSSEGRRYNVSPADVKDVETVESVLSIENDLVYNCMVDNCKIDVKALCLTKADSERSLLIEGENGRDSIRGGKVQLVYFYPKGDYWQVRGGTRSMTANGAQNLKQTIGVDRRAAIEHANKEIQMIERELAENRAKESKLLEESKSVKLQWNQENREARKTESRIKTLQDTLDALHEERDSAENVVTDTTEFEEDVKNAADKKEVLLQKTKKCQEKIEELQPHYNEKASQLVEIKTRNESVMNDLRKAEDNLHRFLKEKNQKQQILDKKSKKLAQLKQSKESQQEVLKGQTEKVNETMTKARLLTQRINSKRNQNKTESQNENPNPSLGIAEADLESIQPIPCEKEPSYYMAKIDQCERKIERELKRRQMSESDPTVAYEKYQRAKKDFNAKSKTIKEVQEKADALSNDLRERRQRWKVFRKHIATMTNETFDDMLNKKGSSGQIEFNHQERTLDLIVQKDNTNENTQTSDVKALSGGERSFTTLSLLLALGESLETPFRVMDEFDVFLDPQSRKIALDTMVQVAKDMEHRQFIFITPQDLSSLKEDTMLKIMKMKPPLRSNFVGGPSQQTLEF